MVKYHELKAEKSRLTQLLHGSKHLSHTANYKNTEKMLIKVKGQIKELFRDK
jgi:hypothetical protein